MPEGIPGTVFGITWHRSRAALWAICCAFSLLDNAVAGGGPENLALVVNARSWASLTVANHYVNLRQISQAVNRSYGR